MKHIFKSVIIALYISCSINHLKGAQPAADKTAATTVAELWRKAIVDDQRDYDKMIIALQKVVSDNSSTNEALTAQFIIGRIELNRSENESLNSFSKAREALRPIAEKHPKTWQGQSARIILLHILVLEKNYREVITDSKKALDEIDWDILGKKAPPDLTELLKMFKTKPELTRDVLRGFIAEGYFGLKEPKEAEKWILQIEDEKMRRDFQEQRNIP